MKGLGAFPGLGSAGNTRKCKRSEEAGQREQLGHGTRSTHVVWHARGHRPGGTGDRPCHSCGITCTHTSCWRARQKQNKALKHLRPLLLRRVGNKHCASGRYVECNKQEERIWDLCHLSILTVKFIPPSQSGRGLKTHESVWFSLQIQAQFSNHLFYFLQCCQVGEWSCHSKLLPRMRLPYRTQPEPHLPQKVPVQILLFLGASF